jgi:predicted amidohydrolase
MVKAELTWRLYSLWGEGLPDCLEGLVAIVINKLVEAWDEGVDGVVFPEYTWMVIQAYLPSVNSAQEELIHVVDGFAQKVWPVLREKVEQTDLQKNKAVVLGSVPWRNEKGDIVNRNWIYVQGQWTFQDKLYLTPWEKEITSGQEQQIIHFHGWRFAVLTCFDIEIAERSYALSLRGSVDLIIVPSATDSFLGWSRINRCASARAIELGCYVAVCHLQGKFSFSQWVDVNTGGQAVYAPAQLGFEDWPVATPYAEQMKVESTWKLSYDLLRKMRRRSVETNPIFIQLHDIEFSEN